VDKEANVFNIADAQRWREEARAWRDASMRAILADEERDASLHLQHAINWLETTHSEHLAIMEQFEIPYTATTDWILKLPAMTDWLGRRNNHISLWLTGKPGLGNSSSQPFKSTL